MPVTDNAVYTRIEEYLVHYIKERNLLPGERLPSLDEISKKFNVSLFPVRTAIDHLVDKGVLARIPNKGAVVRQGASKLEVKTNKIGILYWPEDTSFYLSQFYNPILSGIKLMAEREEKSLSFRWMRKYGMEGAEKAVSEISAEVDGIIIVDLLDELKAPVLGAIKKPGKPAVLLNYEEAPDTIDTIIFDHVENTRKMVRFLIENGHQRIVYPYLKARVQPVPTGPGSPLHTFKQAMRENGLKADDSSVVGLEVENIPANQVIINRLVNSDGKPTAFCCNDDSAALTVYEILHNMGYRIPEDFTITGYDDQHSVSSSFPRLTSFYLPLFEMGVKGVQRLMEISDIKGELPVTPCRTVLPGRIVERETHRSIKK